MFVAGLPHAVGTDLAAPLHGRPQVSAPRIVVGGGIGPAGRHRGERARPAAPAVPQVAQAFARRNAEVLHQRVGCELARRAGTEERQHVRRTCSSPAAQRPYRRRLAGLAEEGRVGRERIRRGGVAYRRVARPGRSQRLGPGRDRHRDGAAGVGRCRRGPDHTSDLTLADQPCGQCGQHSTATAPMAEFRIRRPGGPRGDVGADDRIARGTAGCGEATVRPGQVARNSRSCARLAVGAASAGLIRTGRR